MRFSDEGRESLGPGTSVSPGEHPSAVSRSQSQTKKASLGDRCQKKIISGSKKNYCRMKKKLSRIKKKLNHSTERKESSVLWSSAPLVLWSPGPLVLWSSGPLVPWSFGPLVLWSSGPLVLWSSSPLVLWSPWSSGPLVLWSSGPLVLWSCASGPLVLWSSGPLVLWSSGPLVLWSSGPLVLRKQPPLASPQCNYDFKFAPALQCEKQPPLLPSVHHICTSITLWKATIPCLPDCNCDLKSIPAPHLDEHYSAKNNHPCFPPPHQRYIVESDRKRPPLACLNVTAILNFVPAPHLHQYYSAKKQPWLYPES